MITVASKGMTDVGKVREGNEDTLFYDDRMGLYLVADGMGGHNAGEVASKIVADVMRERMQRFVDDPGTAQEPAEGEPLSRAAGWVRHAIHAANREVFEKGNSEKALNGMGSTVAAVYLTDNTAVVANVGDSPVYLIRRGGIRLVSVLHTMIAEYEAMAPEGARNLAEHYRHMITRGMGLDPTVKPDISEMACVRDDTLIICSDGLTDMVEPAEILDTAGRGTAETVCKALVDLANARGGKDNITVIVLKILDVTDAPAEPVSEPVEKEGLPVNIDTDDASFSAVAHRIELDGAFVETVDPFAVGSEIYLTVSDPDGHNPFILPARVARRHASGIDVIFGKLNEKKKRALLALKEKL